MRRSALASTKNGAPTPALPTSSSAISPSIRSPPGRKPSAASDASVTAVAATWHFMSIAPRPQMAPSSCRPANGSTDQSARCTGTTSRCPRNSSEGPVPEPGSRASRFVRSGSRATRSTTTPWRARYSSTIAAACVSRPGGFDVSQAIRRRSSSVASRRRGSRGGSLMVYRVPARREPETRDESGPAGVPRRAFDASRAGAVRSRMRAIDPRTGAVDEAPRPEPVLARTSPIARFDPLEVSPRPRWPVPAPTDEAAARSRFQHAEPYIVGVEEELLLHDTASGDLAWISDAERATLADDPRYALELPAGQVEAISSPCRTVAEAVGQIRAARADLGRLLGERYRPIAAGTHPAAALPVAITPGERYRPITEAYSWAARRGLASGMHVHVSVPDADVAVRVHDALRSYLPLLAAIGANAPILQGQDTGLASVRPKLCDGLPRQGIPPALGSFRRLIDQVAWGARSGTFPDPSMLWWEARLHLRHGTVEVRTPDAQTSIEDAE